MGKVTVGRVTAVAIVAAVVVMVSGRGEKCGALVTTTTVGIQVTVGRVTVGTRVAVATPVTVTATTATVGMTVSAATRVTVGTVTVTVGMVTVSVTVGAATSTTTVGVLWPTRKTTPVSLPLFLPLHLQGGGPVGTETALRPARALPPAPAAPPAATAGTTAASATVLTVGTVTVGTVTVGRAWSQAS